MINERGNRRERMCKFQRIFGIVLIVLGVIGIIVSCIISTNYINNVQKEFKQNLEGVFQLEDSNLRAINTIYYSDMLNIKIAEIIIIKINLLTFFGLLLIIGTLFYTEGRKG